MNFVGHAFVALWRSEKPSFVLGSMLPDFVGMAGLRMGPDAIDHSALGRGIALHHETDHAFHGSPVFLSLMADTMQALIERGVARGPARAVGHIGVEMLIDGELLTDAPLASAYLAALAATEELGSHVFRSPEDAQRYQTLHRRLRAYGVPYDYRNAESVTRRLAHTLAHRPRLALSAELMPDVQEALKSAQPRIVAALPELVNALRQALAQSPVA